MDKPNQRVALVTGVTGALGHTLARRLAVAGFTIHGTGRDGERWESLSAHQPAIRFHPVELRDRRAVEELVPRVWSEAGRLDLLVNNAGAIWIGETHRMSADAVSGLLQVLLHAPIRITACALEKMVPQGGGQILNICSVAGVNPAPGLAVYGAAKAGLLSFTRSVAAEYGARNVQANAICPGPIRSPLIAPPLLAQLAANGRLTEPDEVAELAHHIIAGAPRYNGSVFTLDGGASVAVARLPRPAAAPPERQPPTQALDPSLAARVSAVFERVFACAPPSPESSPGEIERWDSLGHLNLVGELERELGLRFSVDEVTEMTSFGAIVGLLMKKQPR